MAKITLEISPQLLETLFQTQLGVYERGRKTKEPEFAEVYANQIKRLTEARNSITVQK